MSSPAGWYPDESSPGRDRYWDGMGWTSETRDSVRTDFTPPTGHGEMSQNRLTDEKLLIEMTESEFLGAIEHLSDRPLTHKALIAAHIAETELCNKVQSLQELSKDLRELGLGSTFETIKSVIWTFEYFYARDYLPAVENLGTAMTADFNILVKEMGGSTLLPIPIEQAWENYTRPVQAVIHQMDEERRPYLESFERIRDHYVW